MADKKQTQDPLDLEVAMSASEAFIIKYKNKFLTGIAAIVIVVGGVLGYQHFISEKELKVRLRMHREKLQREQLTSMTS